MASAASPSTQSSELRAADHDLLIISTLFPLLLFLAPYSLLLPCSSPLPPCSRSSAPTSPPSSAPTSSQRGPPPPLGCPASFGAQVHRRGASRGRGLGCCAMGGPLLRTLRQQAACERRCAEGAAAGGDVACETAVPRMLATPLLDDAAGGWF